MAQMQDAPHMSAQAVGGAVGHNEVSIIIPCHRVVGTNGSLTGYAGGIEKKIALLELEHTDMSGFFIPKKGTALKWILRSQKMIKEKGTKRMKIKQQRQIKAFLVNLFGKSRGDMLFRQQEDVYSNIFLRVVRRTNLWDSEQAHGKDYFDVTMKNACGIQPV